MRLPRIKLSHMVNSWLFQFQLRGVFSINKQANKQTDRQTSHLVRFVPKRQLLKVLHILRMPSLSLEVSIGEVKVVKESEENQPYEEL